ncbi:GNAT family N-acetyltransferase [Candidatus Woesearchaeota archaeon]|nr:GNAT family N-acetyltransferase [Candidatus Woesearchaeota archaeon]
MKIKLEGRQIYLRNLRLSDAKEIQKHANDKNIYRYTQHIPYPYRLSHAVKFIKGAQERQRKKMACELGIILKQTNKLVGVMSLLQINPIKAEIGYWLGKTYHGKGIAKEALKLILDFGFKKLKLKRIWGRVAHPNKPSFKLLESAGFKYEGKLRKNMFKNNRYYDELRYGLLREEYK